MALSEKFGIWGNQGDNVAKIKLKTGVLCDAFQRALLG